MQNFRNQEGLLKWGHVCVVEENFHLLRKLRSFNLSKGDLSHSLNLLAFSISFWVSHLHTGNSVRLSHRPWRQQVQFKHQCKGCTSGHSLGKPVRSYSCYYQTGVTEFPWLEKQSFYSLSCEYLNNMSAHNLIFSLKALLDAIVVYGLWFLTLMPNSVFIPIVWLRWSLVTCVWGK